MRHASKLCLAFAAAVTVSSISHAALLNWTGAGTGNWSDIASWNQGVAPVNGDDLSFGTTSGTRAMTNDIANLVVNTLNFPANAYTLGGNPLTVTTEVQFSAGGNNSGTISLLLIPQTNMVFNVSGGRLHLDGDVQTTTGIIKNGPGTLRIQGAVKTYTGDTVVNGGLLDIVAGGVPSGAGKGNVVLEAGTTMQLNNANLAMNGLSDGTTGFGVVTKIGSNTRTLTLGNGDANGSFSGNFTFGGGSSAISKVGAGTQVLNGNGTTPGLLSVSGGRLILNGTWNNGANATGTGILGGTGTLGGTSTITSILAPGGNLAGDTAAVLAFNNLTLNAASTTRIDIDGSVREASYDGIDVAAALVLGGTLAFDISAPAPGTYDIFSAAAAPSGSFAAVTVGGFATATLTNDAGIWSGTAGDFSFTFSQATGDLQIAAVPEPAALGLLVPAAALLAARRRA